MNVESWNKALALGNPLVQKEDGGDGASMANWLIERVPESLFGLDLGAGRGKWTKEILSYPKYGAFKDAAGHISIVTEEQLERLLKIAGFKVEEKNDGSDASVGYICSKQYL